jgi:hypothetical protein
MHPPKYKALEDSAVCRDRGIDRVNAIPDQFWNSSCSVSSRRITLAPSSRASVRANEIPARARINTIDGFSVCFSILRRQQIELGEVLVAQFAPKMTHHAN